MQAAAFGRHRRFARFDEVFTQKLLVDRIDKLQRRDEVLRLDQPQRAGGPRARFETRAVWRGGFSNPPLRRRAPHHEEGSTAAMGQRGPQFMLFVVFTLRLPKPCRPGRPPRRGGFETRPYKKNALHFEPSEQNRHYGGTRETRSCFLGLKISGGALPQPATSTQSNCVGN
jgi:hypothetical protein